MSMTALPSAEKLALEKLYLKWGGDKWFRNDGWTQGGDPCDDQWYGVKCKDISGQNHVYQLKLSDNNLNGTLDNDNSLSELVYLEVLDLSFNALYGTIPAGIFQGMTNLYELTLNYNSFQDTLEWTDSLPLGIGILWVAYNQFHGSLPTTYSKYTSLYLLFFEENSISGSIPPQFFNPPMQNISLLDLGFNLLTGSIPESLGNTTSLTNLWLYDNSFTGEIPHTFSHLTNLELLEVTTNQMTGDLNGKFNNLSNLKTLRLTGNQFFGDLSWSCDLPSLSQLLADNNNFTGLPNCSTPQYSLSHLVMSNNLLSGVIPDGIGNFFGLSFLKVSYNQLTGKIPSTFKNFHNLSRLDISENLFNCELIEIIEPIKFHKTLSILSLSGNQIYGEFTESMVWDAPTQTETLTALFVFDIARNNLTGSVPEYLSWIPNLNELDLSYNHLTGPIPDLNYLSVLYLESNNLTGNEYNLPDYMEIGQQMINQPGENFACPSIVGKHINMRINLDPGYYNYSYCSCNLGYRGFNGSCQKCPDEAVCPGGGNLILVPSGYFPMPSFEDPQVLLKCGTSNFGDTSCNPSNSYNFTCREGYVDRLCSRCDEGYFSRGLECKKCPNGPSSIAIFVVVVIIFILLFLFFIFTDPKRSLPSSTRKTLIYYYQVFNLLLSKLSPWPTFFSFFYSGSSWINFSFGFLCIGNLSFWPNLFIVMICLPVIFFILTVGFTLGMYLVRFLRYKSSEPFFYDKKWIRSGVRVNLLALNFLYLPLCIYIFQNFTCRYDDYTGNSYMSFFPYIQCNGSEYKRMFAVSAIAIVVYVIGIPLLFFGLLYHFRNRLEDPAILHSIGSIYIDYRKSVYWFEVVTILRRFFMAVSLALIDPKSSFSVFVVLLVIGLSIITQIRFKPFVYKISNYAESTGNGVLLFSYACVLILSTLRANSLYDANGIEVILSVVVVVYTIFLGLLFLFSLKYFLPKKAQEKIDQVILRCLLGFKNMKAYTDSKLSNMFSNSIDNDDGFELTIEPIFQKTNSTYEIEFKRRVTVLSASQQHIPTKSPSINDLQNTNSLTHSSPCLTTPPNSDKSLLGSNATTLDGSVVKSISLLDLSSNNNNNNNNG
ncbi:leucine-rich repeat-containing protein (LRR) [Tieghemostelium lacteum]|uniref:Leucine-rich repeat-containing protein (LRR) n=1 Tax=Tieghemostelium lacteum TaxID=361077 RepID=A0A151Z317_TIELA|nr:leucine-rich repeat-containing protein (LRR) [Tieghemostelium lacteum]|eukprot:KYQ88353.1 leucine-rich repeat-containing protein (LRR) [Tieghemostelium lacteum]